MEIIDYYRILGRELVNSSSKINPKLFEIIAAIATDTILWQDYDINLKNEKELPMKDTGIDSARGDVSIQTKYHIKSLIKWDEIAKFLCSSKLGPNPFKECVLFYNEEAHKSKIREKEYKDLIISNIKIKEICEYAKYSWLSYEDIYKHCGNLSFESENEHKLEGIINEQESKSVTFNVETLRKCQEDALNVINTFTEKDLRILMACGSGKSLVMSIYTYYNQDKRIIIFVPSLLLMYQMSKWLQKYKIKHSLIGTNETKKADFECGTFVCVYNSVEYLKDIEFDTIIIDEAHHVFKTNIYNWLDDSDKEEDRESENEDNDESEDDSEGDETEYNDSESENENVEIVEQKLSLKQKILNIKTKRRILFSATLDEPHYEYNLRQAINDNILTDYDILTIELNTLDKHEIVKNLLQNDLGYRKVILYSNSRDNALKLNNLLNQNNISCCYMDANTKMKDRQNILYNFECGYIRCLSVVDILNEGIDIRIADTCIFVDNRNSKYDIAQCTGRILRKHPLKSLSHIVVIGNKMDINKIIGVYSEFDKEIKNSIIKNHKGRICNMNEGENVVDEVNLYDSYGNIIRGDWLFKYEMLKEFVEKNNRLPKHKEEYNNIKIAYWCVTNRRNYKKNKLTQDQINKLSNIEKWWWNDGKIRNTWEENYNLLLEFIKINNRIPKWKEKFNNNTIGEFCITQRRNYKKNKLAQYKVDKLNDIKIWWWKFEINSWENNYNLLKDFIQKYNRLPKIREEYNNIKLGRFCDTQRQYYKNKKLSQDKINRLNTISCWYWSK